MNPAQSHPAPALHIVPKTPKITTPIRRLEAQRGIIWAMIPEIFARYHWDVQEHTELFIKAYHTKTDQTVIISQIGHGTVLVNHDYHTFSVSELHEMEIIADIYFEREKAAEKKKAPVRGVWLTLMVIIGLFI